MALYGIRLYFHHQSYPHQSYPHLWLHLFILSGVISPLISSSILGTYQPGEFIFQCPIFLPFHTVHGVLKGRILKWFAIPFSLLEESYARECTGQRKTPSSNNTREDSTHGNQQMVNTKIRLIMILCSQLWRSSI